jgi:hypothetical protein
LGANSASLSGSEVDSSCSRRAILGLAPVTMLQSLILQVKSRPAGGPGTSRPGYFAVCLRFLTTSSPQFKTASTETLEIHLVPIPEVLDRG